LFLEEKKQKQQVICLTDAQKNIQGAIDFLKASGIANPSSQKGVNAVVNGTAGGLLGSGTVL
jgi:hypothetical protein